MAAGGAAVAHQPGIPARAPARAAAPATARATAPARANAVRRTVASAAAARPAVTARRSVRVTSANAPSTASSVKARRAADPEFGFELAHVASPHAATTHRKPATALGVGAKPPAAQVGGEFEFEG
jgi:hypothetical protein